MPDSNYPNCSQIRSIPSILNPGARIPFFAAVEKGDENLFYRLCPGFSMESVVIRRKTQLSFVRKKRVRQETVNRVCQ